MAEPQPSAVNRADPQLVGALRAAVVGMSVSGTCGVHAHARRLAGGLGPLGVSCSEHWLVREERSLRASRCEVRAWARILGDELREERPDVVLLHYSIFAYSHRGMPLFVHPTLSAVRGADVPIVAFMHEFAFPWGLGGVKGAVWALAHRGLLVELAEISGALLVTTDFRLQWLSSRRWLPRRPLALAPVFSNLPPPTPLRPHAELKRGIAIGLFGYSYDAAAIALVLDAIGMLSQQRERIELRLLGAPGPDSELAARWLKAGAARQVDGLLRFIGPLPAQDLSDELAACQLLLFADSAGPSSRKGTLAGSLASGRPLVAADGPRTWRALSEARAALLVARQPRALAEAIDSLLADEGERESLGDRGRAFAEQKMGLLQSAELVRGLFDRVVPQQRSGARAVGRLAAPRLPV